MGRFKAAFFEAVGYTRDDWQRLAEDLKKIAETGDAVHRGYNGHGQTYVVVGMLGVRSYVPAYVTTVWIIRDGEASPRFVTAYPGSG